MHDEHVKTDRVLPSDARICRAHLTDQHLLNDMGAQSIAVRCSICPAEGAESVGLERFASIVLAAAQKRYDHDGFIPDEEQIAEEVPLAEVLASTLSGAVAVDAADALIAASLPLIRSAQPWYETYDEDATVGTYFSWRDFRYRVKHQSRLLIAPKGEKPASPPEWNYVLASEMVRFATAHCEPLMLGPGAVLYRARIERDVSKLEEQVKSDPSKQMGPPPVDSASAGRMSAAGMPMLYTAREPEP